MNEKDCVVLIPSLEPDEKLPKYVDELLSTDFGLILVIDDGSSEKYQPIFKRLEEKERTVVLHHDKNKGKGGALKTGYQYILDHTQFKGVITADSDGQHTVKDTLSLASLLDENTDELLLGSRDFSRKSKQVPPKSRFGNRITSVIFVMLYGKWLPDTQTGLRAMNRNLLPEFLSVGGERFEYEMNQLITCSGHHIKMRIVPIDTIYLNENQGTHFHPIRDSWRIYKLLLTSFFKFMSSSLIATLVDLLIFTVLNKFVLEHIIPDQVFNLFFFSIPLRFLVATVIARICSATFNFKLNTTFVFNLQKCKGAVLRYVLLCVPVILCSSLFVGEIGALLHIQEGSLLNTLIKACVDTLLFIINFRVQKSWVFNPKYNQKGDISQ